LSNIDPMGLETPRAASGCGTMSWAVCGSLPPAIPSCTEPCGCGPRAPDFALFNINIYVFSVYAEYSKDGNAFVGGGVNFNSPNPLNIDSSANVGWLNTSSPPSGAQIDNFLGGYSGGGTAGYAGAGGGEVWSPGNGTATVIGFGAGEQYQSNYKGSGTASWGYTVPTGQTGITW
jgi:filamentous hemagglutinin